MNSPLKPKILDQSKNQQSNTPVQNIEHLYRDGVRESVESQRWLVTTSVFLTTLPLISVLWTGGNSNNNHGM